MTLEKIITDLNPFDIFSVFKDEKDTIFLDSGREFDKLGRYSFIGINPFITIKDDAGVVTINGKKVQGDIFNNLKIILDKYKLENSTKIPFYCRWHRLFIL